MPIEVDDEGGRAEALQLEDALLGDDAADQERDQHDDRHAAKADHLEVMDDRGDAQPRRIGERAHHRQVNRPM